MKEPDAGRLNQRCSIFEVKHAPVKASAIEKQRKLLMSVYCCLEVMGGQLYWDNVGTADEVTHRIFIRQVKGKTEPICFPHITEIDLNGATYRVRRVTDVNARGVFTLFECKELKNASA